MHRLEPDELLFGRDTDLFPIAAWLRGVGEAGTAALVTGPAGIGKTSLLRHAWEQALDQGMLTASATGVQSETMLPFAGLHQLLHPVKTRIEQLWPAQRSVLRTVFGQVSGQPAEPYLVALAVLELLTEVAAEAPLLVVVDDAQWIDSATVHVLSFVARRIEADQIVQLVSLRDGYASPLSELGLPRIQLQPLDVEAAAAVLAQRHPHLVDTVRRRVLDTAAGNPLALVELPGGVSEGDGRAGNADARSTRWATSSMSEPPLTARLERSFAARLPDLTAITRTALVTAAASDGLDLDEIVAATARQAPDEIVTSAVFSPAVAAGLVDMRGTQVRFHHPLVRSAIYQSSDADARRQAHAALGAVLATAPERQVWHLASAAGRPDEAVAAQLEALARSTDLHGSRALSATTWERAAALSPDRRREGDRLLHAAELRVDLDESVRAAELLARAEPLVDGLRAEARVALMRDTLQPPTPGDPGRIHSLSALAVRLIADGATDLAVRVLLAAASHAWSSDPGQRARDELVAVAESLPLPRDDARRLSIVGYADPSRHGPMIVDRVRRLPPDELDPASAELAVSVFLVGADAGVSALQARVVDALRARGHLTALPRVLTVHSWTAIALGDWQTAVPALDEAVRLSDESRQPLWRAAAMTGQAMIAGLRGDAESEQRLTEQAERLALPLRANPVLSGIQYVRGVSAIGRGLHDEAHAHLRRLFDAADPSFHPVQGVWGLGDLVEAGARCGRSTEDRELLETLQARPGVTASPWSELAFRYAAPLLADDAHADDAFREALGSPLSHWPWYRARLLLEHGRWLRRQRRIADARAPLRAARDSCDALGLAPWALRARNELRATGETSAEPRGRPWETLSPQELQIARLAAEGLSNRDIAGRLFLSHRTVGSHLYRLFPKLGVSSRSQLRDALDHATT
ncbi:MAG: AAA family ATPase [Humibacillus sp.]|nr:AAA family ATPase [Humibacillus sp.]MDN5776153.1 AAA family ATPase [Humibacillus sp.]